MKTVKIFVVLCTAVILVSIDAYAQGIPKEIVLASERSLLTAPVWIAENKGYFEEEGLNVRIRVFDSGNDALLAMLNKEGIHICTVADTPIVFHSFERNDFVIIGAMVYTDDIVKILVREDKGIRSPLDLIDKKIGITKGSTGQFFLDVFLTHKAILSSEVKTVDLRPSELPQALAEGRVDGICVWEPHILEAKKLLDNSAVVLLSYGIYRGAFYFVANKVFAGNNPETIQRFLKAIEKAEEFIQKNEEESIGIVSQRLKTDKDLTALIWGDFSFQLMLDQTILISLEDISRWAIKERLTDDKEIPNYLDFIYMDALEQVKPRAVTIIR